MKTIKRIILVGLVSLSIYSCKESEVSESYLHLYKDLPFEMPVLTKPIFPDNEINLLDFDGNPDGITLNTTAFSEAMKHLEAKGGGKLIVPSGIWFTGPIVFSSNINLYLEQGALILFSSDFDLYPLIETNYEGEKTRRCQSPISGNNLKNIAITGKGSINGSGEAWRPLKKGKVSDSYWDKVVKAGGEVVDGNLWLPSKKAQLGYERRDLKNPVLEIGERHWQEVKDFLRPVMISFVSCENVLLEGVLFENSPAWNIHPLMCQNVIIDNIMVRNPGYSQNGDGLDLESCKNAIIVNSTFDVGDDAICLKSGKDEAGRKRAVPTENVIVDNCRVFQGHGGFVVGSEMSGGVRNVSVSNCQFLGTDVGLRFKSNRERGGIVENIYINNINMFNIATEPFLFDLYYGGKSAVEVMEEGIVVEKDILPVGESTPIFRNIFVKNLTSRNSNRAMYFNGLPEMKISNINVENTIISSRTGAELSEADGIIFKNIQIYPSTGKALILNNVRNMKVENLQYPNDMTKVVPYIGTDTLNIQIPFN